MYIVDMKAHANLFDATYYMQPHQLLFLKVVSDYATQTSYELKKEDITTLDTLASYPRLCKTMHHNLIQHILYHKCRNGETEQFHKKSNPHGCAYDATKVALNSFIANFRD